MKEDFSRQNEALVHIKEKTQKLACKKINTYLDFMTRNLHRIHRRIISGCESQEFVSAWRTAFDHLLLSPFESQVILSKNRDVNLFLFQCGSVIVNIIKLCGTQISGLRPDCLNYKCPHSCQLETILFTWQHLPLLFFPSYYPHGFKILFTYFVYEIWCWSMQKFSVGFQVSRWALCLYAQKC